MHAKSKQINYDNFRRKSSIKWGREESIGGEFFVDELMCEQCGSEGLGKEIEYTIGGVKSWDQNRFIG